MSKFVIQGPQELAGEIAVAGAKNAALAAIPAAFLCGGITTLTNVPRIRDVETMLEIVQKLGANVKKDGHTVTIDPSSTVSHHITPELSGKARSSIMLVGPLLLAFGEVTIGHPGGCIIGRRPIDQFLEGFRALGVKVEDTDEGYKFSASNLKGATYFFPFVSVTATETLMMTAARIAGVTILKNAACEPEVKDLAQYLNRCGAKIEGAGTNTIYIEGVNKLSAGKWEMIPDRLETGMFAVLSAATRSRLRVTNCNPEHVESLLTIFDRMGINYAKGNDWILIEPSKKAYKSPGKVITHEYPGFATDLQPPLTVLLTQAEGLTLVHETIFEGRLFYVDLLNRMGASIILCDPHRALVQGPTNLRGKKIESPDIRAGIAMVIAGLIASGETTLDNIYQIERGYENLDARLAALGAKIERVS
ncbi:UDP-N-acetylglucosamine 1-carboxyvinyltransferase [Candidatus Uhrbacteria bacterium RIFCSPLOWO2_01_FULL_47_24]|uniref:UDP-N-acetylglucosamine 1-carboxyvinyltransferase n=1 Tax=Candidatus Uhrbacteria bacterium RIFCSPLOWO2_01_FULL_47_24 TaxID=1802401 RepID=A0A1F7URL3_9BACT|nr:MAG: UDP-N-acetylglucosamine 1-carboxyvinyltransferase [Candidatus Uhrbacteria bacterium RIFCSPHIGHO2_01_FULL_47_11]OGL67578.1 MAG: UDP-N-acetylglucosamine 1-carboxyvinyltransferase [Candidatus Uhrbacteria bacterium RIFCSPHIGHO2_02_FULL_46_47]OGL75070.1 MAG: UDP-N-acetylglucosamine 1-carboxyvinyltransferase [Candidatus Uhrbacteria bacterium RIFCSPHIGHO2_12_FULL_47_11]OGL80932.1 MAG: UDP-N-acetylglucosamine 1-carboxyvinyltransferase [Candidatus Uhrbacteria bacterium RIFCSPLOWO2_01_FULL_47_24]